MNPKFGYGSAPSALFPAAFGSGWFRLTSVARSDVRVKTKSADSTMLLGSSRCRPKLACWVLVLGSF